MNNYKVTRLSSLIVLLFAIAVNMAFPVFATFNHAEEDVIITFSVDERICTYVDTCYDPYG